MHRFLIFVVSLYPLLISTGCMTTPQVEVFVTGLQPLPSTVLEQRVQLDLRVQNLSERALDITGLDVQLRVNDRRLARGVSDQSLSIPRLAEGQMSVVVSSSLLDTIRQLLALPDAQALQYSVSGKLYTPGLNRRFRKTGRFDKSDLEVFMVPR